MKTMKKVALAIGLVFTVTGSAMASSTVTAVMGALNSASSINQTLEDSGIKNLNIGALFSGFNSAEKEANKVFLPDTKANIEKEADKYGVEPLHRSQAFYAGCMIGRDEISQDLVQTLTRGEADKYMDVITKGVHYGLDRERSCKSGASAIYHYGIADAMKVKGE